MNGIKARMILRQATSDKLTEGPIPEDDEKAIEKATELVGHAQIAWDQFVRGPEVEAILRLDAMDDPTDEPPKEQVAPPEGKRFDPVTQTLVDVEPEPEPDPPMIEPTVEREQEIADGKPEDLSKVEPWDGYDTEKIGAIVEAVEEAARSYDKAELQDLFAHVWAYEAANKNRVRLLSKLEEIGQRAFAEDVPPEEPHVPNDSDVVGEQDEAEKPSVPDDVPPPVETEQPPAEEPAPDPEPAPEPEPQEESSESGSGGEDAEGSEDTDYEGLIAHVEKELRRERIHLPQPPQDDLPEVPWDWSNIEDRQLQKLYSAYSVAAYYKNYILAREERMAYHCKSAAEELARELLLATEKYDEKGKEKRVAILEAEVESDPNVIIWRRRQHKHEVFATAARQERESYSKLVESLSRIETMRHNEWERSGGKIGRGR